MNIHFHIGPDGDGSAARPFDGSLSQHFDLHLRHLAESGGAHHLHPGPGLYLTCGQRHIPHEYVSSPDATNAEPADHLGWEMLPGWKISGAGAEATILRLECWPGPGLPGDPPAFAVVASRPATAPDTDAAVFIEHLTVDAGWPALPGKPDTGHGTLRCIAATGGIRLHCHHVTTRGFHPAIVPEAESGT